MTVLPVAEVANSPTLQWLSVVVVACPVELGGSGWIQFLIWEMQDFTHTHNYLGWRAEPAHDVDIPREIPFVPQSMLDDDLQPELPPSPARGPRHIQGEIQLPESVRDEILRTNRGHLDVELAPEHGGEIPSSELAEDANQTQPVESQEPTISGEAVTSVPQIGGVGGYLECPRTTWRTIIVIFKRIAIHANT